MFRFLILVLLSSGLAFSAGAEPSEYDQQLFELDRILKEMRQVSQIREMLEASGLTAEEIRRQERLLGESIAQLLKTHPHLFMRAGGATASDWFSMMPAKHGQYRWVIETFLGYWVMMQGTPEATYKKIRLLGLEPYFQAYYLRAKGEAAGAGTDLGFRHWLYETGRKWLLVQQVRVSTGKPQEIARVMEALIPNTEMLGVTDAIYKTFMANEPLETQFEILRYVYSRPEELPRLTFTKVMIQNLTPFQWLETDREMFREAIRLAIKVNYVTEQFVHHYGTEEFFKLKFNIFKNESSDPELRRIVGLGEGLTVGEQLILSSETMRNQIFDRLVEVKNASWIVELIDFAIQNGFTESKALGRALSRPLSIADFRWNGWIMQLGVEARQHVTGELVRKPGFYQMAGHEAFQVHRLILQDAIEGVGRMSQYREGEIDPLKSYLRRAATFPELMTEVIIPSMGRVFAEYNPEVWKRYLAEIIAPAGSQSALKYYVIEEISQHRVTDLETLRMLNRIYGVPRGFQGDLQRARGTDIEAELRMLALDQRLYQAARLGLPYRCSQIYQ